ncbi:MAG: hypothetical protein WCG21_12820 [Eubacteriales bacterium]
MPGHAGARFFPKEYADTIISIDTTELSSSDDLHEPSGPARMAMNESSRIYGSGETLFVTTGSTTGMQVMLAAVVTPETFLLLPRTVHMSALHAIALLDCRYAFIPYPDEKTRSGYLFPQLTKDVLENAIRLYPQVTDILLVSPDYYGQCADLAALSETAHAHGCRLLVDEAHGAHFSFAKGLLPRDSMSSGADMCVQSLHKTLPALTMASQIHISPDAVDSGRVSVLRVWQMLRLFETSSPSFVIAASSEYALAWMDKFGCCALAERCQDIQDFTGRIGPVLGVQDSMSADTGQRDPLHLVLIPDPERIFAPDLMAGLDTRGIYIEFADLLRLVLIISPWQNANDFDALYEAVSDAVKNMPAASVKAQEAVLLDRRWGKLITSIPKMGIPLRAAVFGGGDGISIHLSEAKDRICASTIAPYPPGVAVLWPGDRISQEHIDVLQRLSGLGISVRGMKDDMIDVLPERILGGEDDVVAL